MRRLRSSTVVLGGMGVLAATITACGSEPDQRCVDPLTRDELPSYRCESGGGDDDDDSNGSTTRGSYYYGGSVRSGKVSGGSFSKAAVDTGGFGCSGSGGG
ncbi:hypothetical protein [Streptomyces sp. WAC01280]|uniref:hypothetical protein n=1 Tax=Streptomyces sp. WAC01280 TaxID=2487424 RepID=UPI000F7A10D1|nr:hypothetical protein [Streptomyces sp. WAC01280]RSS55083.1 hypothetical protein EF909_17950 [Streptomyces sp. WAC01280]